MTQMWVMRLWRRWRRMTFGPTRWVVVDRWCLWEWIKTYGFSQFLDEILGNHPQMAELLRFIIFTLNPDGGGGMNIQLPGFQPWASELVRAYGRLIQATRRFPKMGGTLKSFIFVIFHYKPCSYWGSPIRFWWQFHHFIRSVPGSQCCGAQAGELCVVGVCIGTANIGYTPYPLANLASEITRWDVQLPGEIAGESLLKHRQQWFSLLTWRGILQETPKKI